MMFAGNSATGFRIFIEIEIAIEIGIFSSLSAGNLPGSEPGLGLIMEHDRTPAR